MLHASGEEVRQRAQDWLPHGFRDAAALTDEQVAEWQRAWDETFAAEQPHRQRLIMLPGRTTIRPERPRKSTPRGLPRMREHTISLLLGALRGDGTIEATIRVSTCRAMRVLPWDIGWEHTSRITAGDGKPTGLEAVHDAYRQNLIEPMARHLSETLLPDGVELRFEPYDLADAQSALERLNTPWVRPFGDQIQIEGPAGSSFTDLHANPSLIELAAHCALPPRGRLKSLIRRITRRNGDPTA